MVNNLNGLVVVYVEDEENVREKVGRALRRRVHQLHVAQNGKEGLELIHKYNPHIVITDLEMPVMNGMEMIAHIRDKSPELCDPPIIVVTAYKDEEHFTKFANLYVYKPIDINNLMQTVEALASECGIILKPLD